MKLQYLSFKTSQSVFCFSLPPEPVGNSAMLAIGARGNTFLLCGKPQHVLLNSYQNQSEVETSL